LVTTNTYFDQQLKTKNIARICIKSTALNSNRLIQN